MLTVLLLASAGFVAGAMNALAGGGSFIAFPAMIFAGLPSVAANASTTFALVSGTCATAWDSRRFVVPVGGVSLRLMLAISLLGGLAGAVLLLVTPVSLFDALVPWLLLVAAITLVFARRLGPALRRRVQVGRRAVLGVQFVLSVYGGYFGGAVGIMMLAAWGLLDGAELKVLNPTRLAFVAALNLIAVAAFIVAGEVWWLPGLAMLVGAVIGGLAGARLGRWLPAAATRQVILAITLGMTGYFFWRAYA